MCDKCNDTGVIVIRAIDDYTRFQKDEDYWIYHSFMAAAKDYNDGKGIFHKPNFIFWAIGNQWLKSIEENHSVLVVVNKK